MKKRNAASKADPADSAQSIGHVLDRRQGRQPLRTSRLGDAGETRATRQGPDGVPPGFSGVMSRVCEMVWPVWPDTASSEHGADLAGADDLTMGGGACGTAVSRHSVLQRTLVAPVDQRRAACTPI